MRILMVVVAIAALPSLALADGRYKRPQPAAPPVNLSDRTRPIEPKAIETKPISSDAALVGLEKAEPVRKEQEEILIKLVGNTPDDDPEKADLVFRLAEHYAKQMRFWRLEATKLEIASQHLP